VNAFDALLRPLSPESGWYWGGTPGDWAAMSPAARVQTEALAISTGRKPPISLARVALLAAGAGALVWFVGGRTPRRNPGGRRRRRRPETAEQRRAWFAAANAATKRAVDAHLRKRRQISTPTQAKLWARAYLRRHPGTAYSAPPLNVLAAAKGYPPDWSPQRYRPGLNKAQSWLLYLNRRR
jgi:hypothetical protein